MPSLLTVTLLPAVGLTLPCSRPDSREQGAECGSARKVSDGCTNRPSENPAKENICTPIRDYNPLAI